MIDNYLLTGAYGFLGNYIRAFLADRKYLIICLGKDDRNDVICNLSTEIPKFNNSFDVVVHSAAKAHLVPINKMEANDFFDVTLQGTKNLCAGLEKCKNLPKAFVFVSTVAVYGLEEGKLINENQPLNGTSPYAKSKIEAEFFLTDWCKKYNIKLSILRLPLIAGTNPPANLGAMIKGISSNRYFNIGGGNAKKSLVMASDVARHNTVPWMALLRLACRGCRLFVVW